MARTKQAINLIDINTVSQDIDNCVIQFFNRYNVDINDLQTIRTVPHNTINLLFKYIYSQLFKPDQKMINNQKSKVDYDNIELLQVLADKFIDICLMFNKSLGLMSFCFMVGCDYSTVYLWLQDEKSNPLRFKVLKSIQECHKMTQVSLLNDTPVGALAVANNDKETGLNWSANQAAQITNNTVYLLPSERVDRFRLEGHQETPTQ